MTDDSVALISQLRATLGKMELALGAIVDAIVWTDENGRVQWCNAPFDHLVGRRHLEVLGANLVDLLPLEQQGQVLPPEAHPASIALKTQINAGGAYQLRQGDTRLVLDISATPIRFNEHGTSAVLVIRDVTERKRQQVEVEAAQAYLQTLQESCPDSIIATNVGGRIVVFNPGAEELLGYSAAEALGQPVEQVYPSLEAGKAVMRAMRADPNGHVRNLETMLRHKDGREIPVLISAAILRDGDGKEQGTVGYAKDITERKRVEQALAAANADLEQAVLNANELTVAAETANRAKSEFLANMSHEIRTPLNAIIGMAGLLLDTRLDAEQRDFAETIRRSGDALLSIINDILDFSKIEAGKLDLETQPFDLRDCVEESLDLLASKAAEKRLDLAYFIEDQVPATVVGDVTRLRQILVNLLSNGVKFTEQGEVVVSVTAHKVEDEDQKSPIPNTQHPIPNIQYPTYEVHFAVRDTGIGISQDRMDRLFQ
ncbi:MAG: PAS domain S-box protein, partial [Anaerolineae bacterium]